MNNRHSFNAAFLSSRSLLAVLSIALVVLFASSASFASSPQGQFERTLQVSGPVDLEVLTRSGDVTVRAGSSKGRRRRSGDPTSAKLLKGGPPSDAGPK